MLYWKTDRTCLPATLARHLASLSTGAVPTLLAYFCSEHRVCRSRKNAVLISFFALLGLPVVPVWPTPDDKETPELPLLSSVEVHYVDASRVT
eukprot:8957017-Pyramimonas_sp.AAC.1